MRGYAPDILARLPVFVAFVRFLPRDFRPALLPSALQVPGMLHRNFLIRWPAIFAVVVCVAGCGQKAEQVTAYSIPKPPPPVRSSTGTPAGIRNDAGQVAETSQAQGPGVMLGAILPRGDDVWFFKLLGPRESVLAEAVSFLQLVRSLEFKDGTPKWSLPEGWTEKPGNQFRFATLVIDSAEVPLEVTVSTLPLAGQEIQGYLLSNINRWRGQLQLKPLEPEELEKKIVKVEVAGEPAWLVNIEGTLGGDTMRAGPSAGPAASGSGSTTKPPATASSNLPFTFDVPEGWISKAAGPMRMAEFAMADGDRKAVASVSTAGGELLANVNRWRGQIGLEPVSKDELEKSLQKLAAGNVQGDYVQLFGADKSKSPDAILGVVVNAVGRQWFIKLQGDADLVRREAERFEAFVKSIRFRGAEGGPHGN